MPLAADAIVARVQALGPIYAADGRALIRNILEQSSLIWPLGADRYGYLPYLLQDNTFRQPLGGRGPVELGPELVTALWPKRAEAPRRAEQAPCEVQLPNGGNTTFEGRQGQVGCWELVAGPEFYDWLTALAVGPGDGLIIRVSDAEARLYTARLERLAERDGPTVAQRNGEVADLAAQILSAAGGKLLVERLAPALIVAGAYRDPVPADPLLTVLARDGRFTDAGLGMAVLAAGWTPADEQRAEELQRLMQETVGPIRPRFRTGRTQKGVEI